MRLVFVVIAVASLLGGTGCEESRELREWRPEDHQQPSQPDSTRAAPGATPEQGPVSADDIRIAAASLFRASCASCHGPEGRGDGNAAPTAMPDLTTAEWQDGHDDPSIARVIRMGSGLMPGFGDQLNDRGISALVQHVRSLRAGEP